jgi:hypothetical protein
MRDLLIRPDHRDGVIETLATSEADALALIDTLLDVVADYRTVSAQLLKNLQAESDRRAKLTDRIDRLEIENAELREALLSPTRAA